MAMMNFDQFKSAFLTTKQVNGKPHSADSICAMVAEMGFTGIDETNQNISNFLNVSTGTFGNAKKAHKLETKSAKRNANNGNNGHENGAINHNACQTINQKFLTAWKLYAGSKMPGCTDMPLELLTTGTEVAVKDDAKAWLQNALLSDSENAFILSLELLPSKELESILIALGVESKAMRKARLDSIEAEDKGVLDWLLKASDKGIVWYSENHGTPTMIQAEKLETMVSFCNDAHDEVVGIMRNIPNLKAEIAQLESKQVKAQSDFEGMTEAQKQLAISQGLKIGFLPEDMSRLSECKSEIVKLNSRLEIIATKAADIVGSGKSALETAKIRHESVLQSIEAMRLNSDSAVKLADKSFVELEKSAKKLLSAMQKGKDGKVESLISQTSALLGMNRNDAVDLLKKQGKIPASYT